MIRYESQIGMLGVEKIMNLPKISIIIPVYKVEEYLNRCIKSVVDQTYNNLEIILVDDGSPDNCPAICDKWAEKDSRIKVIHKNNGGLSDARNIGMKIASGELIGFVDSDDWISKEMYQLLYENMKENESDISACGVKMVWEDVEEGRPLTSAGNQMLNTQEAMEAIIRESKLKQPVSYKLYKTELIRDILFPVGKCNEDVFWTYQAIGRARKVSIFDTPCYYYFQRKDSIMGNKYSLKRLDALEAKRERLKYIERKFPQLENLSKLDLWFSCMYSMQMVIQFLTPIEFKNAQQKIDTALKSVGEIHDLKDMGLKQKAWYFLSKISFEKTCRLRNFLKVGL